MMQPYRRWAWLRLTLVSYAALTGVANANGPPASDVSRALEYAARLQAKGRFDTAVELLKRAQRLTPEDERVAVALAWAYLEQGNKFWALRTATQYLEEHPDTCSARAVAIWIHLQMANPDQAEELLAQPGCGRSSEERARFAMLRAFLAEQRQDRRAALRHTEATQTGRVYAEDIPLMDRLLRRQDPGRLPVVWSRLEVAAGYTSNGLAGSPVDVPTPPGDRGSGLVVVDAKLRAVVPASRTLRPVVGGELRLFELLEGPARDLSYEEPALRAGLLLGGRYPRLLLSYVFDAVRWHGGDRFDHHPLWFSEAHRVEWDWEVGQHVSAAGAAGERRFHDRARTRFETEQGLAASWLLHPSLRLFGAVAGRWHEARAEGWDLVGGSASAELDWALRPRFDLRFTLAAAADWFPRSRGFFGTPGNRRDLLERGAVALWFELARGWQIGSSYELDDRQSTAPGFSFIDHRWLGKLAWSFDSDRYAVIGERGRAPMQWSRATSRAQDASRIQELLRQDNTVKRGTSCPVTSCPK